MEIQTRIQRIRNSVSLKLAVITILSLLLLIPELFVRNLISERKNRKDETITEVTSKWGGTQTICGPVIQVPYERTEISYDKKLITYKGVLHFLPDELNIKATLVPEIRHRGIYKVILYQSEIAIEGNFLKTTFKDLPTSTGKIIWPDAKLIFGITDLKGIKKLDAISWNEGKIDAIPGTDNNSISASGFNVPLIINPENDGHFKIRLSLNGSESAWFVPIGKNTKVNLSSKWNSPSFNGAFLPVESKLSDTGFVADWSINQMNRPYPQFWADNAFNQFVNESSFGVDLLIPVDIYQKTERSVKYALLFFALTFLVLFFIEIIGNKRVHPVQYLITGAGLVIFYSLLLALSEYMSFGVAYIIAAISIISLTGFYSHSLFHKNKYTIITTLVLAVLYTFLFTILSLTNYSLLIGNIGLLIALALIMFLSGKIDWYDTRTKTTGLDENTGQS
jgi:inner membrane protein